MAELKIEMDEEVLEFLKWVAKTRGGGTAVASLETALGGRYVSTPVALLEAIFGDYLDRFTEDEFSRYMGRGLGEPGVKIPEKFRPVVKNLVEGSECLWRTK